VPKTEKQLKDKWRKTNALDGNTYAGCYTTVITGVDGAISSGGVLALSFPTLTNQSCSSAMISSGISALV
jgi:hypothetical protein